MEREYVAFISYRHKPLDIAVAKQVQRLIEHYRIPRDMRKDGRKRLGYVFRDQDELPLSSDLNANITNALDASQFLIVICTPDTPKSLWVEREIGYFLKHHDRSHVMTVLADGSPDESFPELLTHVWQEDGVTLERLVEPLAANMVSSSGLKRYFLARVEFLRLVATILGCLYDVLRQREKRYRQQKISLAAFAVALAATGFAGMLFWKNREIQARNEKIRAQNEEIRQKSEEIQSKNEEIQAQFEQAQQNESYALSLVSEQLFAEGDRDGAVENALTALPSASCTRPLSVEAELALSNALYAYQDADMRADCRIEQETDIEHMLFGEDGGYVVTMDAYGCLRCFNGYNGRLLWKRENLSQFGSLAMLEREAAVFYSYRDKSLLFSLQDGVVLQKLEWPMEEDGGMWVSGDGEKAAHLKSSWSNDAWKYEYSVCFYRLPSFEKISESPVLDTLPIQVFPNVRFSEDGAKYAMEFEDSEDGKTRHILHVLDVDTGNLLYSVAYEEEYEYYYMDMIFCPDGDLLVFWCEREYGSQKIQKQYLERLDGDTGDAVYRREFSEDYSGIGLTLLLDGEGYSLWCISDENIMIFHALSGKLSKNCLLPDKCKACYWLDEERSNYVVVLEDGSASARSRGDGYKKEDMFAIGFNISKAYGNNLGTDYLCVVPENKKDSAVIYRYRGDTRVKETPVPLSFYLGKLYFSPSGDRAVYIEREDNRQMEDGSWQYAYLCLVYDTASMEETGRHEILSKSVCHLKGFSADETRLVFNRGVCDLETGEYQEVSFPAELLEKVWDLEVSHQQPAGAPTILAVFREKDYSQRNEVYWCEDGDRIWQSSCPYEGDIVNNNGRDDHKTVVTGGSGLIAAVLRQNSGLRLTKPKGYAVYSTGKDTWTCIENPCQEDGFPAFCVGNVNPWVAFADYDGMLRIADGDTGEVIRTFPLGVAADAVRSIYFLQDDRIVLLWLADAVQIMDTREGTVLTFRKLEGLSEDSDLVVQTDDEGNNLYIGERKGSVEGICIDLASGNVRAVIPGLAYFVPNARLVIKWDAGKKEYVCYPAYTTEELVEMGEKLLCQP